MIELEVKPQHEKFAKDQINAFKKIKEGKWRYTNVEAWRGIVCEILIAKWLNDNYEVEENAKGLDDTGIIDDYDMKINGKKIEIKSATKNYFQYIMPKIHDIQDKPKDFYIGAKFNETVKPNIVQLIGFIEPNQIKRFPIKQNKGAPYYEVPLNALIPIKDFTL